MIWIKALHVAAMVTWIAALFYLPRLFVYHVDTEDAPGRARFEVMERRLYVMMTIGGSATILLGAVMVVANPIYLTMHWLQAKLLMVAILMAYHGYCYRLMLDFRHGCNQRSAKWFRKFNEIPSLLLLVIVALAIVKPF